MQPPDGSSSSSGNNSRNETYLLVVDDEVVVGTATAAHPSLLPTLNNSAEYTSSNYRWIKNCSSPTDNIDLEDPRVIGSLVPLGIICLVVIFGNIMVIAAVRMTRKMRGATNLFIVSLAWADLTLGIIVLPFSAMFEVFGVWIFGRIWCSIWLAVDVWTCTASILHLVVISLDRYIAVTHPITYPNIMTSNRAKLLICGAWILSFVICFPPLVGWKEEVSSVNNTRRIMLENSEVQIVLNRCFPKCELIKEPGYVIYSAVGSFYAPMLALMFFNWRIYRTATKTTKAIRQGWTKVKGVKGEEGVGMGIHRGGAAANSNKSMRTSSPRKLSSCVVTATNLRRHQTLVVTAPGEKSRTLPRSASNNCRLNVSSSKSSSSRSRDDNNTSSCLTLPLLMNGCNGSSNGRERRASASNSLRVPNDMDLRSVRTSPNVSHHQPCPNHIVGKTYAEQGTQTSKDDKKEEEKQRKLKPPFRWRSQSAPPTKRPESPCSLNDHRRRQRRNCCFRHHKWRFGGSGNTKRRRRHSLDNNDSDNELPSPGMSLRDHTEHHGRFLGAAAAIVVTPNGAMVGGNATKQLGKRNIKSQVRRFRMETKAAKTLGIIVGCFICCWFPFFTTYLITAFCEDCFPALVFSVIFWLGYCNSAINPFIYAMFSRDFRNAFKKILCKFLCNRQQQQEMGALVRMGGLPFAPQNVAIGLADRFPPATLVTSATGVITNAAGNNMVSGDNSTSSSHRTRNSLYPS